MNFKTRTVSGPFDGRRGAGERMDFRDLGYFETVADLGHLGLAAEKVCRTQSALSKCIRRLEEELGMPLFRREGRGIVLTAAGALLFERSKVLRRSMETVKKQLLDFSLGITGHIRLGASATMAEWLLPELSSRFLAVAPDVTMQLTIGLNDVLRDALKAGHIDLMLGPLEEDETVFSAHPIFNDDVVVVAGPDHPIFARLGEADAARDAGALLSEYRWVLPSEQVTTRRWLDARLRERGLALGTVQLETNLILVIAKVIARNHLLSLLSRRNLGEGRPGYPLREVPIPGMVMRRRFGVLYRDETYMTPATVCLLNLLRQEGGGMHADL